MMNGQDNQKGFTLLELILAISIVAIIAALLMGGVRLGMLTRDAGEQKVSTLQRMRVITEQLSQKIKSLYPVFVTDKTFSQTAATATPKQERYLAFQGGPNFIRFATFMGPLTDPGDRPPHAHETMIFLGEMPETRQQGIVMMERDITSGNAFTYIKTEDPDSRFYLLAEDVAYLKFRYYQMEEITLAPPPGSENSGPAYRGEWMNSVFIDPEFTDPGQAARLQDLGPNDPKRITLPRAVEISIGLHETPKPGAKGEPAIIFSPPIVVLLNSGIEFALPIIEENAPKS